TRASQGIELRPDSGQCNGVLKGNNSAKSWQASRHRPPRQGTRLVLWSGLPELDSPKTVELPPPNGDAQGFVPLFNGKDLTGWHVVRGNAGDWQVEQGQLRFTGTGWEHRSFLVSDKEYTDYAVRFEFQADDKAIAG